MIISDACIINIINDNSKSVFEASRGVIDNYKVMLQIVASLYSDCYMFIVQATLLVNFSKL